MSGRTMVMYGDNGIDFFFTESTNQIVGSFLHFGVGTLDGVEFNTIGITSGVNRGNGTSSQTDTIIVSSYNYNLVSFLRSAF